MTADETGVPGADENGVPGGGESVLGSALRRALAGYRRAIDRELAGAGFADRRFPEGRVLRMCARPGQTTISDIGRGLGITRQGASKIIAGMKDRGYVTVTPSEADGREKIITLTPLAAEFLTALQRASAAIEARVRQELGSEGTEQLVRFLDVIAGGEPEGPERRADTPAIRGLRWLDASGRL